MTITFKEFCQVVALSDEEFEQIQEAVAGPFETFKKGSRVKVKKTGAVVTVMKQDDIGLVQTATDDATKSDGRPGFHKGYQEYMPKELELAEGVLDDAKAFAKKLLGMTPEKKAAALAKIETERKKLATLKKSASDAVSAKAKEKDDAWAAAMVASKDQGRKGTMSNAQAADSIADLGAADRLEKRGAAASSHMAHRQKNLGMA